jgi:hypothetical protein
MGGDEAFCSMVSEFVDCDDPRSQIDHAERVATAALARLAEHCSPQVRERMQEISEEVTRIIATDRARGESRPS